MILYGVATRPALPATLSVARVLAVIVVGCSTCLPLRLSAAEEGVLRAGVARTDITPAKPCTLSGYASRKELSQGVHDPLSARVVAFERSGRRLVLVSTDVIGFYGGTAEPLRKAILEACRLEPPELFLTAIHTHSAPHLTYDDAKGHPNNVEYTKNLEAKLVGVVRSALDGMAPVRVSAGTGSSPVGVNRREPEHDDQGKARIRLGRNPSVLTDREVQVLGISRVGDDRLAAVLFVYATHSTSMGPKNYIVSGDVHGLAEQFIEKHLGNGVIAPAFAGASGDIDPWFRVLPEFNTANGWIPEPVLLGTMLGEEAVHVLKASMETVAHGPVKTIFKTLELPAKPREQAEPEAESPSRPLNITIGRVGDIAFAGLGAEVFNEIGKAIKSASPFRHTFVITHCNGAAGYLPPEHAYPEGGYEIETSRFAPAAADAVIKEVVRLLRELY